MHNPWHPPPAPPAFGEGHVVPETQASWPSRLVFGWLDSFLAVGFSRPLEKNDLWDLPPVRRTENLTNVVQAKFYARCPPEKRPAFLRTESTPASDSSSPKSEIDSEKAGDSRSSEEKPPSKKSFLSFKRKSEILKPKTPKKYDASLIKALHRTFMWRWWSAGFLSLCSTVLVTTTPLVTKALLAWGTDAYIYFHDPTAIHPPQGIGYGLGVAFAIFIMQEGSSLMNNHYMLRTMTTGLSVRTSVIGNIFRKSLRLSGKARMDHSVGQITTMISADASRLDMASAWGHNLWIGPVQVVAGVALLIYNLGYSALVGLGVIVLAMPIQFLLVKIMINQRKQTVKFSDTRVRLLTEMLQGIRLVKFYAWEAFQVQTISGLREKEIRAIRIMALSRASLISLVTMIPVAASVLSFITYSLSGHTLNVAIIFSSLQFFNIIRTPIMMFPLVVSSCSDAVVALDRISKFLIAEEGAEPFRVDPDSKYAIDVDSADFTWEVSKSKLESLQKIMASGSGGRGGRGQGRGPEASGRKQEGKKSKSKSKSKKNRKNGETLPTSNAEGEELKGTETPLEDKPFELKNVKFKVPKGSFVAIVGRVGSGKSSLLQALIGEMRREKGEVTFGGTVSYVPQAAWIMNATLRENVTFGKVDDNDKFEEIVNACSLVHDLDMLPYREQTEIGEKGINLSGGQKARVSLARAAYSECDIVLLDDPLSAVDAHVGKAILENCLLSGPLADKTRVLVTHALHVLDKTDYIYVLDNGIITEEGTYEALMKDGDAFSRLIEEFGSLEKDEEKEEETGKKGKEVISDVQEKPGEKVPQTALMQAEERNRGAVALNVYGDYLRHAGGLSWAPIVLVSLTLTQAATLGNNLFLGYWSGQTIHGFTNSEYMGVYAALGVAQTVFSWGASFAISLTCLRASLSLFKGALIGVLHSSIPNFFDTTPTGRIISRFSKDQDTLDTQLQMTYFQLLSTLFNVLGTVALVFYTLPYLGIIFVPLFAAYYIVAVYYRRSSVETKRLDSLMRSNLYASYSETLTGLPTVRAYQAQERFIRTAEQGLDGENKAYYMTVTIQRWLGVRLDFLGNLLILGICLFAVGFRNTLNPSYIGVVLSYSLGITQTFSAMVSTYAQAEQDMNAVERVLVYSQLPPEGEFTTPNDPPPSWPERGEINFVNVEMAYREGLPLVLRDVSFRINAGEKIGIVGRTGAGKSSLLQALFRIVELNTGKIEIDGLNTRDIGLNVLRHRLALVPQDSTLFIGSLRDNLDPQHSLTDAELIAVLQRAWLLPKNGTPDAAAEAKFGLDASVSDEGSNYSAGEKQLLSLCRALVKNSRIIVLDEATSSVDVETDAKLQKTIQTEFASSTLLCIAHRLNTIVYYDRILVMDAGKVAEFDTPLNLFDREDSIFRSLCNEASLSRQDIVRIREGGGVGV